MMLKTIIEPINAAPTKPKFPGMKLPKKVLPISISATLKLAPELIPKTNGPAIGFRKRVCINKPLTPKLPPTKKAVIALGNLNCHRIGAYKFSASIKLSQKEAHGIHSDPNRILRNPKNVTPDKMLPHNK